MNTITLDKPTISVNGDHLDELPPTQVYYTFPSSGVTVIIQKVSQRRVQDHHAKSRRDNPAPIAPKEHVDVAGEAVLMENPGSDAYKQWQKDLLAYETKFQQKELEWVVSKTLVYDVSLVSEYRARALSEDGTDYSEHPDWFIFLWHIAALNPSDWIEAQSIALFLSQPTPAAIADARDRFRRQVQLRGR